VRDINSCNSYVVLTMPWAPGEDAELALFPTSDKFAVVAVVGRGVPVLVSAPFRGLARPPYALAATTVIHPRGPLLANCTNLPKPATFFEKTSDFPPRPSAARPRSAGGPESVCNPAGRGARPPGAE
jgi:hypothetical protein